MQRDVEKFGISDKRGRAMTHKDPFAPEAGLPGVQICKGCHAVYHRKCWKLDPELYERCRNEDFEWTTCSACLKADEHYPVGYVTLGGQYLRRHRQEIENALHNVADEAERSNPLDRIIRMKTDDGSLLIETTTVKLAERLGRALERAHQGKLDIDWSGEPRTCRVTWSRDE